jgi:hypothetical protein
LAIVCARQLESSAKSDLAAEASRRSGLKLLFWKLGRSMSEDMIRLITQICVSCALRFSGLSVLILETGEPEVQKLAAGWVGAVVGYWLR